MTSSAHNVHVKRIERILLPIDGAASEHSAIEYAAILAVATGASVTLLHVDEPPDAMVAIVPGEQLQATLRPNGASRRTGSTRSHERCPDSACPTRRRYRWSHLRLRRRSWSSRVTSGSSSSSWQPTLAMACLGHFSGA